MKEQAKPIFFLAVLICHLPLIESMAQIEGITADVLGTPILEIKLPWTALAGDSTQTSQNIMTRGELEVAEKR
jgi:hypothetical protein